VEKARGAGSVICCRAYVVTAARAVKGGGSFKGFLLGAGPERLTGTGDRPGHLEREVVHILSTGGN
jgi:hypothetical protein